MEKLKQENDMLKLKNEKLERSLERKNQTIQDLEMQLGAFGKIGDFGECVIKQEAI